MALRRQRQENFEFKASLDYTAREKGGGEREREEGRQRDREMERETHTQICLESLNRGFGHSSASSNLMSFQIRNSEVCDWGHAIDPHYTESSSPRTI